jgi:hypothetical protein
VAAWLPSARFAAFNPYNYQTGSVWPHDNAIIAMGFKFYGFGAEAARIAHDISIAASHFLLKVAGAVHRVRARRDYLPGAVYRRERAASLYFRDALCLSEESKKLDRCVDRVYAPNGVLR